MSLKIEKQGRPDVFVADGLTNNTGLPPAIVDAVIQQRKEYTGSGSDLSASGVTTPPRIYWLQKRHKEEIVEDVSDLIWSMLGTAVHNILESAGKQKEQHIVEERFHTNILGWEFSGQLDHYNVDNGVLSDYKVTSVYAVKGDHKEEWEAQLNCLRYLLHLNGINAEKLNIVAILRDWSKIKAKTEKDYPKAQIVEIDIPVWSIEEAEAFLELKIASLQVWGSVVDNDLPFCSEKDRWAKPTKWAVMKGTNKRATKLHDTEEEAQKHAEGELRSGKGKVSDVLPTAQCQSSVISMQEAYHLLNEDEEYEEWLDNLEEQR